MCVCIATAVAFRSLYFWNSVIILKKRARITLRTSKHDGLCKNKPQGVSPACRISHVSLTRLSERSRNTFWTHFNGQGLKVGLKCLLLLAGGRLMIGPCERNICLRNGGLTVKIV